MSTGPITIDEATAERPWHSAMRRHTHEDRDPNASKEQFHKLLAEARRLHRPHQPVNWSDYEHLKKKLMDIFETGTPGWDESHRQILDALECGE